MAQFTANIPQPGDFPADSQPLLLDNNLYLLGVASKGLLKDHQMTLDTANANDGTHKQVTMANQANPGFTGGDSVLFANLANGRSQLFFSNNALPGAGVQITAVKANVPTVGTSGCSFLPGGLLIQWGQAAVMTSSVVNFPVAFSFNAYSVVVNTTTAGYGSNGPPCAVNLTTTGFTISNATGVSVAYNITYIAIGLA